MVEQYFSYKSVITHACTICSRLYSKLSPYSLIQRGIFILTSSVYAGVMMPLSSSNRTLRSSGEKVRKSVISLPTAVPYTVGVSPVSVGYLCNCKIDAAAPLNNSLLEIRRNSLLLAITATGFCTLIVGGVTHYPKILRVAKITSLKTVPLPFEPHSHLRQLSMLRLINTPKS